MDDIIEITADSSLSFEGLSQCVNKNGDYITVGNNKRKRSEKYEASEEIQIVDEISLSSSPQIDDPNESVAKPTTTIDNSVEFDLPFVNDSTDSNVKATTFGNVSQLKSNQLNKKIFKRSHSLLDDIRDELSSDMSSSEDSLDIDYNQLSGSIFKNTESRKRQSLLPNSEKQKMGTAGAKNVDNSKQDIIIIDETESSVPKTFEESSKMSLASQDLLKDFLASSQGRIDSDSLYTKDSALITTFPDDNIVTSSQNKKKNLSTSNNSETIQKRKESNIRLLTKNTDDELHTVDLDISLFLDDDKAEITPVKIPNRRSSSVFENPARKLGKVAPVIQRSQTTLLPENSDTISNMLGGNSDFVNTLSKYIINGRNFSDEESKNLIKQSLQNDKIKFRQVNQIHRDNQKARECIIVDMPKSLIDTFKDTKINVEELLEPGKLRRGYVDHLPIIRFFRHCDSIYDFKHDYYYPCESQIIEENVAFLFYDTKEFFDQYINKKVELYKSINFYTKHGKQIIVVLNDINKFKRQIEAVEDKQYKAKVNEHLVGTTETSKNRSKSSSNLAMAEKLGMSAFTLEQKIRFIDRRWGVQIVTVNSAMEFIHALPNIVTLIAKKRTDPTLRFLKYAYINVKSGKDQSDILRKVIHDIGKIPDLKSGSIVRTYPKFVQLLSDFENGQLRSDVNGNHLMTPAMESRLYKLFTSHDPSESIP
ncbi:similar to Saccharomyces cerevisiae YBR098W MMS4 Subunit of the structure-specific Mms4p- Mus81p endonuclease that cleaves branched DNA [Maudiozyma barnettii]|uniref:Similar to Saccharomyces cerevisiae YBR098W MMS4 Subunit of the structure-specific Mms4p- Mus81p endonuclease that cleaves branched DNA n=1 Tax=Maudiozyma barnettii TaxID=61262 RepID=A0A8H2ZI46_9SACH|nr:Mms4p [Kazachstania barnettii]CAB4255152.1 similar to Saccharomyces cerevisiae YBR098W MMS4 Subunit of the structure-specific Mms4p- Mus81p endonuclease that cleaves branched DNA [Kazachstania barnettii]CAD1783423.1 similar to Saccharomyces cerevisiae YBR098W MMS4 Subunit of the structure-specific Mms4p- Mus81p endonuclease that cleaves branched DNA [Kazachstania barnettii]